MERFTVVQETGLLVPALHSKRSQPGWRRRRDDQPRIMTGTARLGRPGGLDRRRDNAVNAVSMRAVAMIVSEPPSSMFLAAPKNRFDNILSKECPTLGALAGGCRKICKRVVVKSRIKWGIGATGLGTQLFQIDSPSSIAACPIRPGGCGCRADLGGVRPHNLSFFARSEDSRPPSSQGDCRITRIHAAKTR